MSTDLHLFLADGSDGEEMVIARDVDDAWAVYIEHCGVKPGDDEAPDGFSLIPDDKRIGILAEEADDLGPGATKLDNGFWRAERTAAEWVTQSGRGFLSSRDF